MSEPSADQGLLQGFRALSHFFVGDGTVEETLDRVAQLANDTVVGSNMVGITMGVEGRARTAVFTDELSPELDQTQYDTGVGPCLDAYRDGHMHRIVDTETDDRWAAFCRDCAAHGIRSTLSMPLVANGESLGALNFYSRQPQAFLPGGPADEIAEAFATQASIVLANAQAYWDAHALGQQLTHALQSRAVIEQAKGLLMASGHTADAAFQMLVRASQRENRKLNEVASAIVAEAEQRAGRRTP